MTLDPDKQILAVLPAPSAPSMDGMGTYLSNWIFEIPENQRGYSWTIKNITLQQV
jgi:hypothetical protein